MTTREDRLDALLADLTLAAANASRERAGRAARSELRRQVRRVRLYRDAERTQERLARLDADPRPEPPVPESPHDTPAPDAWKARAPYRED